MDTVLHRSQIATMNTEWKLPDQEENTQKLPAGTQESTKQNKTEKHVSKD